MLYWIDILLIIVYLCTMVVVGIACRGKQDDVNDYFTTRGGMGNMMGSILVGLSIAATFFSGISFLAYPSVSWQNGVKVLICLISLPGTWLITRFWFLKRYLRTGNQHPYQVIEDRLGSRVRTVAASMYVLLRIGWMSALIYAPVMAVMATMDLSSGWFWPLALLIGLSATIYTAIGGVRGVIITDAIQFLIMGGGVIFTIGYILWNLPAGLSEAFPKLAREGLLKPPGLTLSLTIPFTFWSALGFLVSSSSSWMADQMSLQRYLTTANIKATSRSMMVSLSGVICVIVLLVGIGLSLRAWFMFVPDPNLPVKPDKILPYFIASQLPAGIAGLMLAALLSATVSSITSGVNTLSAVITLDFQQRCWGGLTPRQQVRFGKICSIIIGLLSTISAGLVNKLGSIFQITMTLLGAFLGPLLLCMLVAVSNRKVHRASLIAGMVAGCAIAWLARFYFEIMVLWVSPTAFLSALTVTALGTAIFGPDTCQVSRQSGQ